MFRQYKFRQPPLEYCDLPAIGRPLVQEKEKPILAETASQVMYSVPYGLDYLLAMKMSSSERFPTMKISFLTPI